MKFCTLVKVQDGEFAGLVDVSLVDDGHPFGISDDGQFLHIEGGSVQVVPA